MFDRETETLWSHFTGEAFEGAFAGERLEWVQAERTTYRRLLVEHPDATVPRRSALDFRSTPPMTGRADELGNRLPAPFVPTLPPDMGDETFHMHGLGVTIGAAHRFYPLDQMSEQSVINDRIGDVDLVVFIQDGTASAAAYASCVDGQRLTFDSVEYERRLAVQDKQTKTIWTADGRAVEGPLQGSRLTSARSLITDWYGWKAYFQDSDLYGTTERVKEKKRKRR